MRGGTGEVTPALHLLSVKCTGSQRREGVRTHSPRNAGAAVGRGSTAARSIMGGPHTTPTEHSVVYGGGGGGGAWLLDGAVGTVLAAKVKGRHTGPHLPNNGPCTALGPSSAGAAAPTLPDATNLILWIPQWLLAQVGQISTAATAAQSRYKAGQVAATLCAQGTGG